MLLKFNSVCVLGFVGFNLIPGVNEVTDDQFKQIKSTFKGKILLDEGKIEVVAAPKTDAKGKKDTDEAACPLIGMPVKEAVETVKATLRLDLLNAWKAADDRKAIQNAIEDQLQAIKKAAEPAPKKGDKSDKE